jgi:hypothetical protein
MVGIGAVIVAIGITFGLWRKPQMKPVRIRTQKRR